MTLRWFATYGSIQSDHLRNMSESRTSNQNGRDLNSPGNEILKPLNESGVKRFHYKTILIAGMGFFTDAYDLFVIGVITALFTFYVPFAIPGYVFSFHVGSKITGLTGLSLISAAAIFGAVFGPMIFGRLGDLFGRKTIYGIEMVILMAGAVLSSVAWSFASLVAFRFILGLGIGGDYPMSATIMSEYSNVKSRGRLVGAVFAMQGFGLITGILLAIGLLYAIPTNLGLAWRLMLFAGAIPAAAVYYFRRRMPETPRYTLHVQGKARETANVVSDLTGVSLKASQARKADSRSEARNRGTFLTFFTSYLPLVIGTALSWFLFDVSFYGTGIETPTLLKSLSLVAAPTLTQVQHLMVSEQYSAIIALIFTIPGYWIAVALIDRAGRKTLQYSGFAVMAIAFAVLGLDPSLIGLGAPFVIIYGLTFLFGNIGPNTTTFIVPTEVFPTAFRTTGHGIAAGTGKIGATVGVILLPALLLLWGAPGMFLFLSSVAAIGTIVTLALIPETKQATLEETSRENLAESLLTGSPSESVPAK